MNDPIEAREFTYCSAFYSDEFRKGGLGYRKFLIMRGKGVKRADVIAAALRLFPALGDPTDVHWYPRTYVKDARAAYREGRYVA